MLGIWILIGGFAKWSQTFGNLPYQAPCVLPRYDRCLSANEIYPLVNFKLTLVPEANRTIYLVHIQTTLPH